MHLSRFRVFVLRLQEIGLQSLTSIQRGSVFIERNPNLCYVDTIDWARIAYSGRLDLKIKVSVHPLINLSAFYADGLYLYLSSVA